MTSDEDSDSEQDTSEIDRNIAANDNREYNVPFDWGDSGQVEMRTVK